MKELKVNRTIFWDISKEEIPSTIAENPTFSIPRIFARGTIEEINDMIEYYGFDKAKSTVMKQLAKGDLALVNLACLIFKAEKKDFECYKNKQFRHIY